MSLFNNISSAINSATTAITTIKNTFNNLGPASGLSSTFDNVTGFLNSFGGLFKTLGVKLPLENPLFNYASYNYVLGIGCLSDQEANAPDATYMTGSRIDLICKSANADFNNRVQTAYGQFDFFIDNLVLEQSIGFEHDLNTNVTDISFNITEPYSMGMFFISLETLARNKGHKNWRDATWILTIEFRGNLETGKMDNIPTTFRCIPFVITDIDMTVDHKGAIYNIGAMPTSQVALTNEYKNFKTEVSIDGKSVQEVLQTGPKSLQVYLNTVAEEEAARRGPDFVPDEYVILFPKDWSSSAANKANAGDAGATTDLVLSATGIKSIYGVTRVDSVTEGKRGNLQQAGDDCNELGRAIIDVDGARIGTPPIRKNDDVFDDSGNVIKGKVNTIIDPTTSNFKFPQDSDIPNAINQVLLKSDFVRKTLGPDALTGEGWRKWWRLDMQVYKITTDANLSYTGEKPKVIVIRVIPYNVHASRVTAPNVKVQGFDKLKTEAVKQYDYIYTGKNIDIIDFKIFFDNGFITSMLADSFSKNSDIITGTQSGAGVVKDPMDPVGKGNEPEIGVIPTITKFFKTITNTDKKGGSGPDSTVTRAGRLFHDAITKTQGDMIELDMTIIGDPYYIAQSGMGNYTGSSTSDSSNLLDDGSINYQNGEVDIVVNFRTPIDINQGTGLYTFTGTAMSAPVTAWSGIYRLTEVTSTFKGGEFKQLLGGYRRPYQEANINEAGGEVFNTRGPKPSANSDAIEPTDLP